MSAYDDVVLATPDLIAYYPLDETSGSVATDASGNGHHGTWNNATKGNLSPIPAESGDTTAAGFDRDTTRRIILPSSLQLAVGDSFTGVSWMRVPLAAFNSHGGENRPVFTIGDLLEPNRCCLHIPNVAVDAQGAASFDYGSLTAGRTYGPDLRDRDLIDRPVFAAAVANTAAATRDIYVNGEVAGSAGGTTAPPSTTLAGGYIGWWTGYGPESDGPEQWMGVQAGVAFFRRALTFTEIRALYCAGDPTGCGGGWHIGKVPIGGGGIA